MRCSLLRKEFPHPRLYSVKLGPGDGLLVQTPVYFPFLRVPDNHNLVMNEMELTLRPDGQYEVDFDLFEATITGRTRVFLLCSPHNPVGRVWTREELARMGG